MFQTKLRCLHGELVRMHCQLWIIYFVGELLRMQLVIFVREMRRQYYMHCGVVGLCKMSRQGVLFASKNAGWYFMILGNW